MPRVKGFLKIIKRRPGTGGPVDPDYGIEEGVDPGFGVDEGMPGIDNELPTPPPGVWPPPTVSHPIVPVPPETAEPGEPGHLPAPPPGSIWPKPPGPISGLFIVLAHIPDMGWRYVVIDPDGWPDNTLPEPPVAQPK
jgi:hypothetical protein